MKKYIATLLASFVCMQSVQAIPSNLGESLLEYAAIENSPLLQDAIPQSEIIVDIKRKCRKGDNSTEVVYFIRTISPQEPVQAEPVLDITAEAVAKKCGKHKKCPQEQDLTAEDVIAKKCRKHRKCPQEQEEVVDLNAENAIAKRCGKHKRRKWCNQQSNLYRAQLTLSPNPELGPPIITVDSITQIAQFNSSNHGS